MISRKSDQLEEAMNCVSDDRLRAHMQDGRLQLESHVHFSSNMEEMGKYISVME